MGIVKQSLLIYDEKGLTGLVGESMATAFAFPESLVSFFRKTAKPFALAMGCIVALLAISRIEDENVFVSKCKQNGRDENVCSCVYTSLAELPGAYREEAVVWATQSDAQVLKKFGWDVITSISGAANDAHETKTLAEKALHFVAKVVPMRILPRLVPYVGWVVGAFEAGTGIDSALTDRAAASHVYIKNGCGSYFDNVVDYYGKYRGSSSGG